MINVANGNLVVRAADVAVHERGLDFSFVRTYNSQSRHDAAASDGSTPSVYGNGWTNTYDVHLAYNGSNIISVYDGDGARYDYASDGQGHWVAPPGQHAQLVWDGACGYEWIQTTGTIYAFWAPSPITTSCVNLSNAAYMGRLSAIYGRNHNNHISFTYAWVNGDASSAQNLAQIAATHSDGQTITLKFSKFGSYTELAELIRPDGQTIAYSYDAFGNLLQVSHAVNAVDVSTGQSITTASQGYGYYSGTHELQVVESPRYLWSVQAHPGSLDGAYYGFVYNSNTPSGSVTTMNAYGNVNPTITDSIGTSVLQPSSPVATGASGSAWYSASLSYSAGQTSLSDSEGHGSTWQMNAAGNVTVAREWTGSLWLVTQQCWDSADDMTCTIDPAGNQTDYGFDASGNLLYKQEPTIAFGGAWGTGRPVTRYVYDSYNNLVATCDAAFIWKNGPSSCTATVAGATRYIFDYSDASEPYGKLITTYNPLGYRTQVQYATSAEGGDFGLPTLIYGDAITQNDQSQRAPQSAIIYDSLANAVCTSRFQDSTGTHWTRTTFDQLNRPLQVADPDDASLTLPQCPNTAGIPGSHIVTTTSYNPDGSVASTQSPAEAQMGLSTTHQYDADGNEVSLTRHVGVTPSSGEPAGTTRKWYDGEDRLVEVLEPLDGYVNPLVRNSSSSTYTSLPDPTRYFYDIGSTGQQTIAGVTVGSHGNLFARELYFQQNTYTGWIPTRVDGYDMADRINARYTLSPQDDTAPSPTLHATLLTYDGVPGAGLLSSVAYPTGVSVQFGYDADGRVVTRTYSDATPSRAFAYDPDGRMAALQSSRFGQELYSYDNAGNMVSDQEASSGGFSGASTISYDYYPDGLRKDLSLVGGPAQLSGHTLQQFSYRADGKLSSLNSIFASKPFQWTFTAAGRQLTVADPYTGTQNGTGGNFVSRTSGYDASGQLSSLTLPDGNRYSGISHDAEGGVSGYTAVPASTSSVSTTYTLYRDVRGESTGVTTPGNGNTAFVSTSYAYGVPCSANVAVPPAQPEFQTTCSGNDVTGAIAPNPAPQCYNSSTGRYIASTMTPTFDTLGRFTSTTATCMGVSTTLDTRAFDADDHLTSDAGCVTTFGYCSSARSYAWSPSGRLAQIVDPKVFSMPLWQGGTFSVHWDGDQLLYVTDASGNLVQYNINGLARWTAATNNVTVLDRDFAGAAVSQHNSIADTWNTHPGPPIPLFRLWAQPVIPTWSTEPSAGGFQEPRDKNNGGEALKFMVSGEILGSNREDGFDDQYFEFQGVRTMDVSTEQWTTQDRYPGTLANPTSQRPYMWNNNDPIDYSDASGYCADPNYPADANCTHDPFESVAGQVLWTILSGGAAAAGDPQFPPAVSLPGKLAPLSSRASMGIRGGFWAMAALDTFDMAHRFYLGIGTLNGMTQVGEFPMANELWSVNANGSGDLTNIGSMSIGLQDGSELPPGRTVWLPAIADPQLVRFLQDSADAEAFMSNPGLDICYSCGWSGRLAK